MRIEKWLAILVVGSIFLLSHTLGVEAVFIGSNPRALGMAGSYVALANDASAIYWNPAGLAWLEKRFDLLPTFGLGVHQTIEDIVDDIEDFNKVKDSYSPSEFTSKISSLLSKLEEPGRGAYVDVSAMALVALKSIGFGFVNVASGSVSPKDVQKDINVEPSTYEINNTTKLHIETLATREYVLTLGKSLFIPGLSLGANFKYIQGASSATDIWVAKETDIDWSSEAREVGDFDGRGYGVDLGLLYNLGRIWRVGVVIQNVNAPEIKFSDSSKNKTLDRQVRAGVVFSPLKSLAIAADADLTKTDKEIEDVQDFSLGLEYWFPFRLLALRAGYKNSLTGSSQPLYCAGLGFQLPFFKFDLGAGADSLKSWKDLERAAAALSLSLRF